jgi:hypothetical protein
MSQALRGDGQMQTRSVTTMAKAMIEMTRGEGRSFMWI